MKIYFIKATFYWVRLQVNFGIISMMCKKVFPPPKNKYYCQLSSRFKGRQYKCVLNRIYEAFSPLP
jgi:uncharacterized protein YjaG (DUF416 family)